MLFISSDDKKDVINSIIKSNKNIKNHCFIEKVHEILEIIDFMKIECKVDNIDCLWNCTSFNSRLNEEDFNPPNGCIGIWLNATGKYDEDISLNDMSESSQLTIVYHPISSYISLVNIINEGLKPDDSQDKTKEEEIKHPSQLIGNGVCLYPEIPLAEKKTTSIRIDFCETIRILLTIF